MSPAQGAGSAGKPAKSGKGGTIRLGTRGSALALAQSGWVADRLRSLTGREVELIQVTTHGDVTRQSLSSLGGTGVFATALREDLLAGKCDVVVHSLKDLPTAEAPGLRIAAVPQRADVRDAFCSIQHGSLEALPEGSKIGTGSPRRKAQLLAQRPDLEIVDIRGNVDTRLGMVADGSLDAVILAAAGLGRLARTESITQHLELIDFPTAPGQGALAVEIRDDLDDRNLLAALKKLDHVRSRVTADAERAVLAGLEAGCSAPVGVTAEIDTELFFLTASVYSLDGSAKVTSSHAATPDDQSAKGLADAAAEVAGRVVEELLANGAAGL